MSLWKAANRLLTRVQISFFCFVQLCWCLEFADVSLTNYFEKEEIRIILLSMLVLLLKAILYMGLLLHAN